MTEEDIKPSRKPYNFVNWEQKKCVQYFDPEKPNEDKPWCLKCKRHYEIKRVGRSAYSSGGGDSYKCRKCGSKLTGSIRQIKHSRNVWWLLVPLICLGFGVIEQFSGKTPFSVAKFYIATPILALMVFLIFMLPQILRRMVWLKWAAKQNIPSKSQTSSANTAARRVKN